CEAPVLLVPQRGLPAADSDPRTLLQGPRLQRLGGSATHPRATACGSQLPLLHLVGVDHGPRAVAPGGLRTRGRDRGELRNLAFLEELRRVPAHSATFGE